MQVLKVNCLIFNKLGKYDADKKFLNRLNRQRNKVIYVDEYTLVNSTSEKYHTVFKQIPYEVREF